ncbi:hypothetical protein L6654_29950 [Bradyrhizobium sp. WYCCWR 13023]|uniref:Uncharacterized protein n=1 Tax=Bradyrhizobium zhengyangense TaxID=2911009 RepID=A0A9X1RDQ0_9BRAD|nr:MULTISPECIES: hypothetical protein [Bradyrhizobium]MCG2630859.1 hypothetical protein [Bradyrhizobium zhengyangense]MCG2644478.1 hypothetical protein [Bradyrhizobium zhengyangense]MCG2672078.1 hypothetical protein [Bradyrhizobium zhengyangense]
MELEQRDERRKSNRQPAEPAASRAEQAAVDPPFASEGLEQVRDSHC